MLYSWMILFISIFAEVSGTLCLKYSHGFSRIIPTIFVFIFYGLSFWGLSVVLKKIEVGIAYAVWAGIGTAAVALIGICFLGERVSAMKIASLMLIIVGVVGLNFSTSTQ
ncbi:small multidrug resistance pump [Maridesulfovibrio ferrireducens]|uniref:Small multidrug resistance pump n=1 Tax=Maridesulfovibrio ferrireducens TaxID=246191 RepID=A0A1G9LI76_9BACT|nr:multidrug efflux SMR transporter [Maridesulfovibrio ferrireducens]SDL61614.1 small multidrug resistance pump [Maridesulfovibrio ferrireducens]